ncbi:MAG: hypothetical protein ACYC36_06215 [Bellilinea sp.]
MIKATIILKNGKRDWIDPVIEVTETDDTITITNNCYSYAFDKMMVDHIEYVDTEESEDPHA